MIAECEEHRKLGYYSPYDGCRLHIVDLDPNSASAGGWLEDVSLVKKYEISEEAYSARENTYRNFRKKKMEEDPNWTYQADLESRQGKEAATVSYFSQISHCRRLLILRPAMIGLAHARRRFARKITSQRLLRSAMISWRAATCALCAASLDMRKRNQSDAFILC